MKNLRKDELISIILPIYNVSDYLDRCLKSVTSQTYSNIEILLINDGSTDSSSKICSDWMKKDNRIIYIEKPNEGLGPTRNLGIKMAKGKYIAFVDSDDWVAFDYIEKLYYSIKSEDADIAECNFYRVYEYTDQMAYFDVTGSIGKEFTKEEKIKYANVVQWNKLTKRELWIDNEIQMPNLPGEDLAVNALLLLSAKKVVNVPEALYYYRMGRSNSISNTKDRFILYIKSAQYLVASFKNRNLYEKNKELLYRHLLRWSSRYLSIALGRMEETEYLKLRSSWIEFLDNEFPCRSKKRFIIIGGFNLCRIAIKLPFLEDPYQRYQFSNINSLMADDIIPFINIDHNNPYRKYMIQRDLNKSFRKSLQNCECDFILIDFMEERYDTLKVQDSYITFSDAVKELCKIPYDGESELLNDRELSGQNIWIENCLKFIELLKSNFEEKRIILIENYLCESYGDNENKTNFTNSEEIEQINILLSNKYKFFINNFPGITVIKTSDLLDYYTDIKYEYGCFPWHLNERVNIQIASEIEMKLDSILLTDTKV